jgi:hypothetical protein
MSTGIKGGVNKRTRALPTPAPEIEATTSAAAASKKSKCSQPPQPPLPPASTGTAGACSLVIEATTQSMQPSKEDTSTAAISHSSDEVPSVSSGSSSKKDDVFKKNFTNTVQGSFIGKSNFENNKLNQPSSAVFALSLLEWKFGQPTSEISDTTTPRRRYDSGDGGRGETLDEEFRRTFVKPKLECLVENAEDGLKEALKFIIMAAESDINSKDCCSEGGKFPIMERPKIDVLNSEIGFSLFEYSPLPAKYDARTISRSYFAALKKLTCFLLGHPLFLFQDENAQAQYFEELMTTVHEALVKEIEGVKESKRSELKNRKEAASANIQSLEEGISQIERVKEQNAGRVGEAINGIKGAMERINNARKAHEKMEEAVNSMTACMDCESSRSMYDNMRQIGKSDLESFIEKQNASISEMEISKKEIEDKINLSDVKMRADLEKISGFRENMNDTAEIASIEAETEESIIKTKVSNAVNSYVKVFEPILKCIGSSPPAKKKLMEIMKKMMESDEVVQDGILAIKTSVEIFLENKLSVERAQIAKDKEGPAAPPIPPDARY